MANNVASQRLSKQAVKVRRPGPADVVDVGGRFVEYGEYDEEEAFEWAARETVDRGCASRRGRTPT